MNLINQFQTSLERQVIDRLQGPLESVRGLPNYAFTSDDFYALEQEKLFSRTWVFAGRLSEVPNIGDRKPFDRAGQPFFLIRDADNQVRVFHNVCPHRGAKIVPAEDTGKSIVCPYHAWTFEIDGHLRARPHFHGPGLNDNSIQPDKNQICLEQVRSAIWADWIFINIDGQAPEFESYTGPMRRDWSEYDLSNLELVKKFTVEYGCNWKLAIENYCDFYHVFKVHPELNDSLSSQKRTAMHCEDAILHNETWTHEGYSSITAQEMLVSMPHLGGRLEEGRRRTVFGVIFPNCAVNIHRSDVQFSYFEPVGPAATRLHRYFYFPSEVVSNAQYEKECRLICQDWEKVLREDEAVCQLIQEGRKSSAYDGGRFAPAWDEGTRHFHRLVAQSLFE